jgi:hypothetical protein
MDIVFKSVRVFRTDLSNQSLQDLAGFSSCALTGHSNFKTFSHVTYKLEDLCEHVLAQTCDQEDPDFFMIRVAQVGGIFQNQKSNFENFRLSSFKI